MKVAFKSSFAKDIRKIKDKQLQAQIRELIELVELTENIINLDHLKKLSGNDLYYRIRLGDYRIWIKN